MAHEKYGMAEDSACRMNRALLRKLSDHVCRRSSGDPIWYVRIDILFKDKQQSLLSSY